MLEHEKPLAGFAARIGGSAGSGTHGGESIGRPKGMPRQNECDHTVRDVTQFANSVQEDDISLYIPHEVTIDLTKHTERNGTIEMGSGVELVSTYCDPNYPGRGGEIVCEANGHRILRSRYGEAPTLWGVSMRGPRLDYHDPDHFAPDFDSKQSTGLFCYDEKGTLELVGCEFRGFTFAGLEIGAREYITDAEIRRCTFVRNRMEHLGYGIELYNGFLSVRDSFFDANRHSIAGFGYPTCGYAVRDSVFGPETVSHVLDMHALENSLSHGDSTAGAFLRAYRCSFMPTVDELGRAQEAVAIRGKPVEDDPPSYVDKCHFWHESPPEPTGDQGSAYRQETRDWVNFEPRDNHFGSSQKDGYGAPRDRSPNEDEPEPTKPDMTQLSVHGLGDQNVNGDYEIVIWGDAKPMPDTESDEKVERIDENRTMISGVMWGGVDSFELDDNARPIRAEWRVPIRITLDGTDITGALMGVELAEQQSTIDRLHDRLDSLKLVWGNE